MDIDTNQMSKASDQIKRFHNMLEAVFEIPDLWEKYKWLCSAIPAKQQEFDALKADVEIVRAEYAAKAQEIKDLEPNKKENDRLKRENAALHDEKERLQNQVNTKKSSLTALDQEEKTKGKKIADMNEELARLHSDFSKVLSAAKRD